MLSDSGSYQPQEVQCDATTAAKVKIINPKNAGGFIVKEWNLSKQYVAVKDLKSEMGSVFMEYVEGFEFDIGYIEPGHGMRGKLIALSSDCDLEALNTEFTRKKCVLLWMKCKNKKRFNSDYSDCPPPKRSGMYEKMVDKMHEVDLIVQELRKKQKEKYSPEQLRCWANLIQLNQHDSYETPPNKPFFKARGNSTNPSVSAGISPGKKVSLRSECIEQLDKWHDLMVRGVISNEQYKEMKDTILSDIKKF